jgi:hypothetical protein
MIKRKILKPRLAKLEPPPTKRERQLLEYRAKLMAEAYEVIKPFGTMKVQETREKHPDIEERYQMIMQRVILISGEIESARNARGWFFNPEDPQGPFVTLETLNSLGYTVFNGQSLPVSAVLQHAPDAS